VKEYVLKNDQLQCIRISGGRFFKSTLSFGRFFKLAFVPDRFFIQGIEMLDQKQILKLTTSAVTVKV